MRHIQLPLLLVLAAGAACRHQDADDKVPMSMSRPSATALADVPLAAGDIRIISADGGVDLALIGDSISGGLSQSALTKVRRETDTNAVHGNDFSASIEKMVKGTVQSALRRSNSSFHEHRCGQVGHPNYCAVALSCSHFLLAASPGGCAKPDTALKIL